VTKRWREAINSEIDSVISHLSSSTSIRASLCHPDRPTCIRADRKVRRPWRPFGCDSCWFIIRTEQYLSQIGQPPLAFHVFLASSSVDCPECAQLLHITGCKSNDPWVRSGLSEQTSTSVARSQSRSETVRNEIETG
jgi:hypothetical protein